MSPNELKDVLRKHAAWVRDVGSGEQADLRDADLRWVDLRDADLRWVDLRDADLRWVDLGDADLRGADLRNADLRGATLWDTIGNGRHIITLQTPRWRSVYTAERLQIGCKNYAIEAWWAFSDDEITGMNEYALVWWRTWKPFLQQFIAANPAQPTGAENN